jgi:mRNA interferase YafQ
MKTIRSLKQFKKDIKRIQKSGQNMTKLKEVIDKLDNEQTLYPKYCDHALTGNYQGYWDSHIEPDWLLIYQSSEAELVLVRTGSHSDLFN